MQRRQFLAASLAGAALATARKMHAQTPANHAREFYQIRRYSLVNGPQSKLTESYLSEALIPAVAKLGIGPVGAFRLDFGPETPTYYVLIPGPDAAAMAALDLHLAEDAEFLAPAFLGRNTRFMPNLVQTPLASKNRFSLARPFRIHRPSNRRSRSSKTHRLKRSVRFQQASLPQS